MERRIPAKTIEQWFSEYGDSHQNPINQAIHKLAVPLIMFSVLGLLWDTPFPLAGALPWVNWAFIVAALGLIFYAKLSFSLFIGMIVVVAIQLMLLYWIDVNVGIPLWLVSSAIFLVSWIFQFIGHHIEGKKPSFLKDLQFLLIGPIWVLASLYRMFGVRY